MHENISIMSYITDHVYLNSSMNDIVIRICCVQSITDENIEKLNEIRQNILHCLMNKLEHHQDDDFMTE